MHLHPGHRRLCMADCILAYSLPGKVCVRKHKVKTVIKVLLCHAYQLLASPTPLSLSVGKRQGICLRQTKDSGRIVGSCQVSCRVVSLAETSQIDACHCRGSSDTPCARPDAGS
jgi:hypothetical protein